MNAPQLFALESVPVILRSTAGRPLIGMPVPFGH